MRKQILVKVLCFKPTDSIYFILIRFIYILVSYNITPSPLILNFVDLATA